LTEPDDDLYLVWSHEHSAWWGPGACGYVKSHAGAGRYSRAQALRICGRALPNAVRYGCFSEIPVRVADLRDMIAGSEWASYFGKVEA